MPLDCGGLGRCSAVFWDILNKLKLSESPTGIMDRLEMFLQD